jgi:hypothetical protein
MELIRKKELKYFGKTGQLYIQRDSNLKLDSDVSFMICQYFGKLCGLLNKDLRNRWKNLIGISVDFNSVVDVQFPQKLIKYVRKISIYLIDFRAESLTTFPNLTEVIFRYEPLGYKYYVPSVNILELSRLPKIKTICINVIICGDYDFLPKDVLEKIWICANVDKISYLKNKEMIKIVSIFSKKFPKISKEGPNYITFDNVISIYLGIRHYYNNGALYGAKINIITSYDILAIDYYENVMKSLYSDIGIATELLIFGEVFPNKGCNPYSSKMNTDILDVTISEKENHK